MRAGISADVNAQGDMLVAAEAQDGIEALELFHKFRPDVSLVGLRMPKLDGIEVRGVYPNVPKVAVSCG
jgi:chemotaxis response regulator CheB